MFSIQIRVDEGKKEELLEALNGLRQNIDFEFQAADEQHKQSVTDPGTRKARGKHREDAQLKCNNLISCRRIERFGRRGGRRERKKTNAKRDRYQIEPVVGPQRCCSCGVC